VHSEYMDNGPVWTDPHASRRFAASLARLMLIALVAVTAVPLVIGFRLADERVQRERDADLAFHSVVAIAPADAIGDLLAAADRVGWVVDANETIELVVGANVSPEWQRDVGDSARRTPGRWFTTTDPSGTQWTHSVVTMPGDSELVVGRRTAEIEASGNRLLTSSALIAIAAATVVALLWLILQRRVVRPTQALLAAGDDLRVRGKIRPQSRQDLPGEGSAPLELGGMSNVLQVIEADVGRGFEQASALLQAASVLGGSLDPDDVVSASLEHLQGLLRVERSVLLRFDTRLEQFDVIASRGHSQDYLDDVTSRGTDSSLPSVRAVRDEIPMQVPDTEAEVIDAALRERGRRHGYRAVLAVPLAGHLHAPTVLVLHSHAPRTFSFDEIELSKSFASIAGAALHNAELFESTDVNLRTQTSRLDAIVESVDQGLIVEGADGVLLFTNTSMRRLLPESDTPPPATTREFLSLVLTRSDHRERALAQIDELTATATPHGGTWCDVAVPGPPGTAERSFRVRKFAVCDSRGQEIGRGQTWLDVSEERRLEQMKSGLLAAVSHEFRTPLTLIKGYATTLLADDVTWSLGEQSEFLHLVSSEADRLTVLVQRLLDMRRIDAGMVPLELMPVSLDVIVQSAIDSVGLDRQRIDVVPLPDVVLVVDAARVVTAMRNLLENACKYSPASEMVTLAATIEDDTIELHVRDRGEGIADDLRGRIFDTFVRGDTGLATANGGIGIGLSIARGFVEAHGGQLFVRDPVDGPGAVFVVSLPSPAPTQRTVAGQTV